MSRMLIAACAIVCAIWAAGCGSDSKKDKTTKTTASKPTATASATATASPTATTAPDSCQKVKAPKPKEDVKLKAPKTKLDPKKTWTADFTTTCGNFTIRLDVKRAPKTTASFGSLIKQGFYDNLTFHRIVPGFVVQGGDPVGADPDRAGSGDPGYSVTEAPPADLRYTSGIVAMAKTGTEPSGTSGSQFFVVIGQDVGLPAEYALVGKVTSGMDVVQRIGLVNRDAGDVPLDPVVMTKVTLTSK